ncbi:VCBS domain-containing protein [Mycobacterium sp. CVI_P3]|uniref:VCBS domain-containing protein n=1 Tax=Mycobacterium pinniadriaticum TaxID=2994102 RepID=A0ABT3SJK8_9MYCO|nr:VCBS domain-containing protein [Mycobacterium pinniadriaticum]MCX2932646.1 VCBS domain-containing protein [Mycobacterium pinniadriaticum]MCX2939070.1 VCBS domain-containing protein [Mycobacterium pinniadriaticum]
MQSGRALAPLSQSRKLAGTTTAAPRVASAGRAVPPADGTSRIFAMLTGALSAASRDLENVLENKAPVLNITQISEDVQTGVVKGSFGVYDQNSDPVAFTVISDPSRGTVRIDNIAGTYEYTPTLELAAEGGWDAFTVEYNDIGFHLFDSVEPGIQNVDVWVSAIDTSNYVEPPPPAGQPLAEEPFGRWPGALQSMRDYLEKVLFDKSPVVKPIDVLADAETGVVLGTLDSVDPNSDPQVFIVTKQPTFGTVIIDDNGGYYYKVDPESELALTGGTDSFTVEAHGVGWHLFDSAGPTTVDVTVAVPKVTPPASETPSTAAVTAGTGTAAAGASANGNVVYNFKVYNQSSDSVRLSYGSTTAALLQDPPPDGTILKPGNTMEFSVILNYGRWSNAELTFTTTNTALDPFSYTVNLGVPQRFIPKLNGGVVKCTGPCTPGNSGDWDLGDGGGGPSGFYDTASVVLLDRPGTTRKIGPDEAPLQEQVMQEFCALDGVKCTWGTRTKKYVWSPFVRALPVYDNFNKTQSEPLPEDTFEVSHQWAFGFKITGKASFKILDAIGAEISAEFNATWTTGRKYTQKWAGSAPPDRRFIVWKSRALIRTTGDVTVQQGNTTYVIQNVGADMPDVIDGPDGTKATMLTQPGQDATWVIGQPLQLTSAPPPSTYDSSLTYP